MFKKIFIKLCAEKGVSPSHACSKIGISPAAFSQWNDNTIPRKVTQQNAANYFGVTVDYLLGKETGTSTSLSPSSHSITIRGRDGSIIEEDLKFVFWNIFVELCESKKEYPTNVLKKLQLSSVFPCRNGTRRKL